MSFLYNWRSLVKVWIRSLTWVWTEFWHVCWRRLPDRDGNDFCNEASCKIDGTEFSDSSNSSRVCWIFSEGELTTIVLLVVVAWGCKLVPYWLGERGIAVWWEGGWMFGSMAREWREILTVGVWESGASWVGCCGPMGSWNVAVCVWFELIHHMD